MEKDKRCRTCVHWNNEYGFPGESNGGCSRLGSNNMLVSDAITSRYITFHKDGNPQAVSTGANFGCVRHDDNSAEDLDFED